MINLDRITHVEWEDYLATQRLQGISRICITTSGYERRSREWADRYIQAYGIDTYTNFVVYGFSEFSDKLSRMDNDEFYRKHNLSVENFSSSDSLPIIENINRMLLEKKKRHPNKSLEIHIDYTSMPRLWYCGIAQYLMNNLQPQDVAYFWYTQGRYLAVESPTPKREYPSAGIQDFRTFSGRPSIRPEFRTHIFGLGFDKIRTQAIWSILDPQKLACFYAEPAVIPAYEDKVKNDNPDMFRAAQHIFPVPIKNFVQSFSTLRAIAKDFRMLGDVILVPDGPKPLILASYLIPLTVRGTGILCLHVLRRNSEEFEPIDVDPENEPTGFRFVATEVEKH